MNANLLTVKTHANSPARIHIHLLQDPPTFSINSYLFNMPSGGCFCGKARLTYTGDIAVKVSPPSLSSPISPILTPFDRPYATASTAAKSPVAPTPPTSSFLKKASPPPAPLRPSQKPQTVGIKSRVTFARIVDRRCIGMDRVLRGVRW
jgi:hypothetical protein